MTTDADVLRAVGIAAGAFEPWGDDWIGADALDDPGDVTSRPVYAAARAVTGCVCCRNCAALVCRSNAACVGYCSI